MNITNEDKQDFARTYESHYERQYNIANQQSKDERNKRILKEGEIVKLKTTLQRTLDLLDEKERENKTLKQQLNR